MEASREDGVQFVCTAKGWFPEPQVYWEDILGEKLLTVSEHHIPDEDGMFYVEDKLVVRNSSVETVSCYIYNPVLDEGKEAVITFSGQYSSSRTWCSGHEERFQGLCNSNFYFC
jgi:hypothetical protein